MNKQNVVEADISNAAVDQDEKAAKEKHDAVKEQNGVEAGISNAAVGQDKKAAKEKHDTESDVCTLKTYTESINGVVGSISLPTKEINLYCEFHTPNQSFEGTELASQPALALEPLR